jgi:hypothetical protein
VDSEQIPISKLAAARSQLTTALWLWFHDVDIISVHTLTGAARGIIFDLYQHRFRKRPKALQADVLPADVSPRRVMNALQRAEGFFKHARNDPEEILRHDPFLTEVHLFIAAHAYMGLTLDDELDELPDLIDAFAVYYGCRHSSQFDQNTLRVLERRVDIERTKNLSRKQFFDWYMVMVERKLGGSS